MRPETPNYHHEQDSHDWYQGGEREQQETVAHLGVTDPDMNSQVEYLDKIDVLSPE